MTTSQSLSIATIAIVAVLLTAGCGQSVSTSDPLGGTSPAGETYPVSTNASSGSALASLKFTVPDHVEKTLKRKCYICHGGAKTEGGFNFKEMIYQANAEPEAAWRPMDLAGVTRIKLAILPINGKPARMPKRFESTWNPLTPEETNAVAKWTDYPFER